MKNNHFRFAGIIFAFIISFSSALAQTGLKVAYVEVDSLMTQYDFAKDFNAKLQKIYNARNALTQKGLSLQAAENIYQQKLNNNGFQSIEQATDIQEAIQRQQNDLQELQNRLEKIIADKTNQFTEELRYSLQNVLKDYNSEKKFDLILSKAGDNILLADKKYDITKDVVNSLNKRYKFGKKAEPATEVDEILYEIEEYQVEEILRQFITSWNNSILINE